MDGGRVCYSRLRRAMLAGRFSSGCGGARAESRPLQSAAHHSDLLSNPANMACTSRNRLDQYIRAEDFLLARKIHGSTFYQTNQFLVMIRFPNEVIPSLARDDIVQGC